MKKYLAAILAALLVFAVFAVPAFADGVKFTLTGPDSVAEGETVVIKLSIEGSYKASIVNLLIEFDKSAFKFEGYEYGSAGKTYESSGICSCGLTTDGKAVSFGAMFMTDEGVSAEGELVSLTFRANTGASASNQFKVTVEEFGYMPVGASASTDISYSADPITVAVTSGSGTTDPTDAPVDPTDAPVDPTDAPVDPTDAPVDPTDAPVDTTDAPADATDVPVDDTDAPIDTTDAPIDTTDAPADTTDEPVDASEEPVDVTEGPADTAEPTRPEPSRQQKTIRTVFIVLGSILGAALLCVCGLLIGRSIKNRKK